MFLWLNNILRHYNFIQLQLINKLVSGFSFTFVRTACGQKNTANQTILCYLTP